MTGKEREELINFLESNVNICWFLMDGLWMWGLKIIPTILVLPLLVATAAIFKLSAKTSVVLIGIVVGSGWILFDIFWMLSELYEMPWFYTLSRTFFLGGVVFIIYEIISSRDYKDSALKIFSHFRKFIIKAR